MFCKVISGALRGMECYPVTVEVDVSAGLPCMELVGFLSSEVREAKERVRVAMKNCKLAIPAKRVTVNLSPANVKKAGSSFDLPIAVGILSDMRKVEKIWLEEVLFLGELGLDGSIKGVRGVLPIVLDAKKRGIKACVLPKENEKEGRLVEDIEIIGVSHFLQVMQMTEQNRILQVTELVETEQLQQVIETTERKERMTGIIVDEVVTDAFSEEKLDGQRETEPDFSQVAGQEIAKRAAVIAAAGFHHFLMLGVPGAGKTMIAKRIPGILPKLSKEECLEISQIYSIAGMLTGGKRIEKPPFVSPHHSATMQALTGGGNIPMPGALSLAHKGVLFLDEMTEFKRVVLDSMRQPMEEKKIQLARTTGIYEYPADFMLVGAMNLCPCGYFPDVSKCRCTTYERRRYIGKVSGPLMERMDLCISVEPLSIKELTKTDNANSTTSEEMAEQVKRARRIQRERYAGNKIQYNSRLNNEMIKKYCLPDKHTEKLLEEIFKKRRLSARTYYRILKVARTIADLEGTDRIEEKHVLEALACTASLEELQFDIG